MSILSASLVSHAFGDRAVLRNVSLSLQAGERAGLVGANGCGKSTLAQILAGVLMPDSGDVIRQKSASIAYLGQQPGFADHESAREVVLGGLAAWKRAADEHARVSAAIDESAEPEASLLATQAELAEQIELLGGWDPMHRVEEILGHLGIANLDEPVGSRSGGERRRIDLARVLVASPTLMILDEPTNHLDIDTIEWLEELLTRDRSSALLLVTHDRRVLSNVVDRTLELDRGSIHSYAGGWEAYLDGAAERLAHEERTEANRQNLLRRELDWLRRSPKARTTKQKARVDRARALIDDAPDARPRGIAGLAFEAARSGKSIAHLNRLTLSIHEKLLVDGLDLDLVEGERVGIVGKSGAGKTTLLRVLLGALEPTSGAIELGVNTRFAYFDQERAQLDEDKTVIENVADNRDVVELGGRSLSVPGYLSRFLFSSSQQRQKVATLSGGERARVLLAKFLLEKANVLLLDEPTNDLDVETLGALEEMLIETAATVLFVTHDRTFLDRVATSVLAFEEGGRVTRYAGSYQAYREARERANAEKGAQSETGAGVPAAPRRAPRRAQAASGLTFTEAHELEGLMPLIEEAEAEVEALEAELSDPDLFAIRGHEVPALTARLDEARAQAEARIARWEELEQKRLDGES